MRQRGNVAGAHLLDRAAIEQQAVGGDADAIGIALTRQNGVFENQRGGAGIVAGINDGAADVERQCRRAFDDVGIVHVDGGSEHVTRFEWPAGEDVAAFGRRGKGYAADSRRRGIHRVSHRADASLQAGSRDGGEGQRRADIVDRHRMGAISTEGTAGHRGGPVAVDIGIVVGINGRTPIDADRHPAARCRASSGSMEHDVAGLFFDIDPIVERHVGHDQRRRSGRVNHQFVSADVALAGATDGAGDRHVVAAGTQTQTG